MLSKNLQHLFEKKTRRYMHILVKCLKYIKMALKFWMTEKAV